MQTLKSRQQSRPISYCLIISTLLLLPVPKQLLAQDDTSSRTLRRIGKTFAKIAEKASPAVVGLTVEKTVVRDRRARQGRQLIPKLQDEHVPDEWLPIPELTDPVRDYYHQYFLHPAGPHRRTPNPAPPRKLARRSDRTPHHPSHGSGFIVSDDGHILTNYHVVSKAKSVSVKLADGRSFEAKIIGTDQETDLAVIKINADNLPSLQLGDSDSLRVGEWVVAMTGPIGLSHPFAPGMVTAKNRSGLGLAIYEDFIQTDAAITVGSGGGPLLNLDGKVVGINTAIKDGGPSAPISFAIPINMAKVVCKQLARTGKVERAFLGVQIADITQELADALDLDDTVGALVCEVVEGSSADKAGIENRDVIRKLNGRLLRSANDLRIRVALLEPGRRVHLVVVRDGIRRAFNVVLGSRSPAKRASSERSDRLEELGLFVENLTAELAEDLGYRGRVGVVVTEVDLDSQAARTGIRPGSLIWQANRRPVRNIEDLKQAVERAAKTGILSLLIKNRHRTQLFVLKVPGDNR
jgi:serine protease Do